MTKRKTGVNGNRADIHYSRISMRLSYAWSLVGAVVFLLLAAPSAQAQNPPVDRNQDVRTKPYGSAQFGDIDAVNISSGALSVTIPIMSYPQRGGMLGLDFVLRYENQGAFPYQTCFIPGQPCTRSWIPRKNGFSIVNPSNLVVNGKQFNDVRYTHLGQPIDTFYNVHTVYDANGGAHRLGKTISGTYESLDATALRFDPLTRVITDSRGVRSVVGFSGMNLGTPYPDIGSEATLREDPNGNRISFSSDTGWIDTIGRNIPLPQTTTDFSGCTGPRPIDSAKVWNLPGQSGGTYAVKLCYAVVPTQLGWGEGATVVNLPQIQSMVYPNGNTWTFQYDEPGNLSQMTFPTGGTLSYTWTTDIILNACHAGTGDIDFINRVVTRTINPNDGTGPKTWQYDYSSCPQGLLTTVVTDPLGNDTVHGLTGIGGGFYETRTQVFQGSRTSGFPLVTTNTDYSSFVIPITHVTPDGFHGTAINVAPIRTTITWPNGMARKTEYDYDVGFTFTNDSPLIAGSYPGIYGKVAAQREFDFGSGGAGALLRQTNTSYLAFSNIGYLAAHLLDLPTNVTVFDGQGSLMAQTNFGYDQSALVASGVSIQLNPSPPTGLNRGNPTSISRWLDTNNTFIVSNTSYFDTGMVQTATDPLGRTTTFAYSLSFAGAYLTQVANALGHFTTRNYDFNTGLITSVTDANNQTTGFAHNDSLNRLTLVTRPTGGGSTTYSYSDTPGNLFVKTQTAQDATSYIETFQYFDGLGRPNRLFLNEGGAYSTVDTQYDNIGRVLRVSNPYRATSLSDPVNPPGLWTTNEYDALNRVIKVTTPDGAHVDTAYNGNQVTVTDQAGKRRRSENDALGRLIKVTEDPGGRNYDTVYFYDALGNLRYVGQGAQGRWFAYDSLSRLIRVKNPEQNTNGGLPPHTDPVTGGSGWSTAYSYDANGNLTQRIDARNVVTNYYYDDLNRNTGIDYINGSQTGYVRRVYDGAVNGKGRLYYDWTQEGSVPVTHMAIDSYDALGRALTKRQHFWRGSDWGSPYAVQQSYNLTGAVKALTYPSGHTANYSYDQASRLSGFSGALGGGATVNYIDTINYNAAGQMIKARFGTNTPLYRNLHYNNRLQLVDARLGDSATDEWNWSRGATAFLYGATAINSWDMFASDTDNNGNLRRQINYAPLEGGGYVIPQLDDYTYDGLNRVGSITEAQMDGSGQWTFNVASQSFDYDRYGNRQTTGVSGGVNNYNPSYDQTTNRINGLGYDAAGNITSDPLTGGTMTYDAESRLLMTTNGGGSYIYDAEGRRVKRITGGGQEHWYIYGIGGELLAEYAVSAAPSAPQKEYGYRNGRLLVVWDGSETGDRQLQWLFQDHLGSTRMVVDRSGSLTGVRRHDYLPFGEELSAGVGIRGASIGYSGDSVRQKYAGYERDNETGLDFAQARYYASIQGRFTSVDPLMASAAASLPQSWNRYGYCLNNPLNIIDPSGMIWGILDGNISWYKDEAALKNAGATEWTQRIYQAGNGQWIHLDENGPNPNADLSKPWGLNERRGWSVLPGPPMEPDMDSQLAVGGIFNAARVGLMSLAETLFGNLGRNGMTEVATDAGASVAREATEDILVLGRGPMSRLTTLAKEEGGRLSTTESSLARDIFKQNYRDMRMADRIIQYLDNVPTTLGEVRTLNMAGQFSRAEWYMIKTRPDLAAKTIQKFVTR